MAVIVTRAGKGSPLTNNEVDANFVNLNTELGLKALAGANSDITSMSGLTGAVSSPLSIQFGNGSAVTVAAGKMWYNNTTGSMNVGMGGGNITQQIGEELFEYGKASAAITDSPLQIVYQTGTVGASGVITFAPTVAGITNGDMIIGVATENIALNAFGRITAWGIVHGITTDGAAYGETWADNDTIWYNPVTGNPTKVKPVAPNIKVSLGTVVKAGNGGSGSFKVEVIHGSVLGGTDSNVQLTSEATNDILQRSASGYWVNVTPATARTNLGLAIGTNVQAWDTHLDQIAALVPTADNFIVGNGTSWTLETPAQARTSLGVVIGTNVQAWDADLDAIAALAGTSGFLKKTAANTWSLDTSTYLTSAVTSVTAGAGLSGGTITSTGTIALPTTGVSAGSYTSTSLTVDAYGRITAASSGAGASPGGATTQVQYNNAGAFAGSANLTFNGTNLTCGGTVTANSDESLKTNWRELPADFVERLADVKHGTYDRTDMPLTQDGVSAQSLRKLLESSVLENEDGLLSVAYGNAALVSAIQLAKRLVALEATVAKLVD